MTKFTVEPQPKPASRPYVLMTAAYNEEAYIERTIQSILTQTHLPRRWVIVSDGSVDGTDEIVRSFARKHEFISFLRNERSPGRSFGSKVAALRHGSKLLESVGFEFIGNVDADVSVGSSYFEDLIARFELDPKLGLAAGFVCEKDRDNYESRSINRVHSVAHAAQLVRRECYEAIGGYAVLEYGGEDWCAQISARMRGWTAEAFPELQILHHRPTGTADNLLRSKFREGRSDYSFGSDPLFEVLKCLRRLPERPFVIGGIARFAGFTWSYLRRDKRPVGPEVVTFLRNEQRQRLFSIFHRVGEHRK
jgi:biofilm PGA synthesis N-glycosyltransferase PgaC